VNYSFYFKAEANKIKSHTFSPSSIILFISCLNQW